MKLPNHEEAHIPEAKLYDYLLSPTHPVGKGKAKFFRLFGFNEHSADVLEAGLLAIAQTEDVVKVNRTPFGVKYIIDGTLLTPENTVINVRTVWIMEPGEERPRFVTAHPREK